MRKIVLPIPQFAFVIATRAALGAGIGMLLAEKLGKRRRAVGLTLVAIGALTTIPALITIRGSVRRPFLCRAA